MPNNLSTMHREVCRRLGAACALRYKQWRRYRDLSWTDYRRQADGAAAALIALGVKPGEPVAILSENRYEWLVADHAILSTGSANVPLHAPLTPSQIAYQVDHSESCGIIVSNQHQADKVAEVLSKLPRLRFLISFDPVRPLPGIECLTWEGLKHRGWRRGEEGRREIAEREAATTAEDLATIIYTSGTTGNPKGVMLTHGNLLSNAEATAAVADVHPGDVQLSWLPYSHIYARTVDHYLTTVTGTVLALAESADTLIANLAEIQPMWMNAVPRFYEKVWAAVEKYTGERRAAELRRIFGPRLRHLSSGGAPLPKHIAEGFAECGIPILQGYGLTESSPVISFNTLSANRLGTVGRCIPGVEVRIADDGEVLTRGPHVMKGYWKDPEATATAIVDGWLHTGDVGTLDPDGYLSITDRKKDLIITSGGKNIAPTELERLLISDPYIDQAVVYGDGRPFVSAIIVPNPEKLEAETAAAGWTIERDGEFISTPEVVEFYQRRVDALVQAVSQPERVKKILVLSRPFLQSLDEVTATLKVRRKHIVEKYAAQLAQLYTSESAGREQAMP